MIKKVKLKNKKIGAMQTPPTPEKNLLDRMRFSYSSVSTFLTCNYAFLLTYIDRVEREGSWYGSYGTVIHATLEAYFKDEVSIFGLSEYFQKLFEEIKDAPPPYPAGIVEQYLQAGIDFFDTLVIDPADYDIILLEDKIEVDDPDGFKFIVKPDILLRKKETGERILLDYKSANPYKPNGKTLDSVKLEKYKEQLALYWYYIEQEKAITIDSARLWFVRKNTVVDVKFSKEELLEIVTKFKETVKLIGSEREWVANTKNAFFCNQLCSVRTSCIWRNK